VLSRLLQVDVHAAVWVASHRVAVLNTPLWLVSVVGRGGLVWLAIGAALTLVRRVPLRGFLQLALAILLAATLTDRIVKPAVARERPFARPGAPDVIGGRPHDSSFPSGHAANAFAGAMVLSRLVPAAQPGWWTLAVVIAFSRVYLGVHHPLDVIAGAVIGALCGAIALRVRWRFATGSPPGR